jgi:hypothetical protein
VARVVGFASFGRSRWSCARPGCVPMRGAPGFAIQANAPVARVVARFLWSLTLELSATWLYPTSRTQDAGHAFFGGDVFGLLPLHGDALLGDGIGTA